MCWVEQEEDASKAPMHLDRSGICEDGGGGEGGGRREREGEEKTGEQHEGNAGKDEAERAASSAEEARHL